MQLRAATACKSVQGGALRKSLKTGEKPTAKDNLQTRAKGGKFGLTLVRDQEVGGSNPLAPTSLFSIIYTLSSAEKVVGGSPGKLLT